MHYQTMRVIDVESLFAAPQEILFLPLLITHDSKRTLAGASGLSSSDTEGYDSANTKTIERITFTMKSRCVKSTTDLASISFDPSL